MVAKPFGRPASTWPTRFAPASRSHRDAGSVTPVSGIGGATLFGHDMTLLGTQPASIYDLNGRKRNELPPKK